MPRKIAQKVPKNVDAVVSTSLIAVVPPKIVKNKKVIAYSQSPEQTPIKNNTTRSQTNESNIKKSDSLLIKRKGIIYLH
jgi:hypothetical protein